MASGDINFMDAPVKHIITVNKERANFTGAVFLPTGELLVAERDHERLLLFADDFFYLQEFKLPNRPYDITIGTDGKLYITMHKNKLLKCEIIGDDINILDTYDVTASTFNIGLYKDTLITTCQDYFKILDTNGKELKSFRRHSGEELLAVSSSLGRFYHKNGHGELVGRKISDSNEVFNFKDKSLSGISGIAIDCQGNVYATGYETKNLVQISKNRRKHRVLIEKFDKITKPGNIMFHPIKNMFVIFAYSDVFEVYEF